MRIKSLKINLTLSTKFLGTKSKSKVQNMNKNMKNNGIQKHDQTPCTLCDHGKLETTRKLENVDFPGKLTKI